MTYPSCLIVDDEAEMRILLSQIASMRGYSVRTAEDGFAALSMMRSGVPDLLLSDLNMPGMSGFELLSVVRRLHPQVYVIAISGAYAASHVPNGIAADAYHEKGTELTSLLELLGDGGSLISDSPLAARKPTPLWVGLERRSPLEPDHVLINCPACLRPFRQNIESVNANIRETHCCYCVFKVAFAVALGVKPQTAQGSLGNPTRSMGQA